MKISIIMPVYNNEKKINISVDSVLKQTYSNWELIIVNDGSTDSSAKIIDKYTNKDTRIKVFHKNNKGPSSARNLGLEMSTGEYCIFLDSDDFLENNALKVLALVALRERHDLIFYGYQQVRYSNDNKKIIIENKTEKKQFNTNAQLKRSFSFLDSIYFTHPVWNKMYRIDMIKKNKIYFPEDIYTSEDFIFNLSIYEIAENILVLDEVLYNYVSHNKGTLVTSFKLEKINSYEKTYILAYRQIKHWNPEALNKINNDYIKDISVYINSLYFADCYLSKREKREVMKKIVKNKTVKKSLSEVTPNSSRILIMKFLLKTKSINLLLATGKFASLIRNKKLSNN